ncbi:MAG TPA: hypothetical protein VGD80_07885 [Kofleriaceae bacterium]
MSPAKIPGPSSVTTPTAADQVYNAEQLLDGAVGWQGLVAAASTAVGVELLAIGARLFPRSIPNVSAGTTATYAMLVDRVGSARPDADMADLHARSRDDHPELERMLRGTLTLEIVGERASVNAIPREREPSAAAYQRVGAAAQRRYMIAVAHNLVGANYTLADDARAFLDVIDLEERVTRARERHEAAERSAAEREAERVRAAELAAATERDRVDAERELAAALAHVGQAAADERARIEAVVQLRRRLRSTPARIIRVNRDVYNPHELAACVGSFDRDRCAYYIEAVDRAEQEAGQ